jgi:hypothetical protein
MRRLLSSVASPAATAAGKQQYKIVDHKYDGKCCCCNQISHHQQAELERRLIIIIKERGKIKYNEI